MRKTRELKQKDIINYLDSRKDFFQRQYHVRKMALIGSFARNEQNPQSDVDILIQAVEKAAEKKLEVELGSIIERVLARNEA